MTNYRLFPATNGPGTANSYPLGNPFISGVMFSATKGGCWFSGYWFWCASNAPTVPQKFCLWQTAQPGGTAAKLITAATVTSGTLTAGAWNFVPLATPIQLSIGGQTNGGGGGGNGVYLACTGVNGNFSESNTTTDAVNSFGTGGHTGGIVNGPLTAWSDVAANGGTNPIPLQGGLTQNQGVFSTGGTDPAVTMPQSGDHSGNFWMDVQISDTVPAGYAGSYRLWPNLPITGDNVTNDTGAQTTGTQFSLSQSCTLNNIWFYSPPLAIALPARCQIWNQATGTLVASTDVAASWSGAVASGWVANPYAGITLPAGHYIATIYYGGGSKFYDETRGYFDTYTSVAGAASASGIVNGPLTGPNNATAIGLDGFGNSCYFTGGVSPTYPNAYDTLDGGENRWVDVEVTPVAASGSGLLMAVIP